MQYTVKKQKSRNPHVGGAMDEDTSATEGVHDSTEGLEILRGGSVEIHWDMDIRHAEASNNASLIRKRVRRGGKREIDDRIKTSLANRSKLTVSGLASSAKLVAYGTKAVNVS